MKAEAGEFTGFSKDAFKFLNDLVNNNNVQWFNENRERYQKALVEPARAFITEMGEFFNRLNPAIRTAPKFNETIMRINKDMRFSKGEPYRDYFLIHFGRFKLDSEFYCDFEPDGFHYGLFINNSSEGKEFVFGRNIEKYSKQFLEIMDRFRINGNYDLHELKKGPVVAQTKFNANKHFSMLQEFPMMLLQKSMKPSNKLIFSPDIIMEAIKTFSILYPVYCFAVFPQPMKMIEKFEDEFGFISL